MLFYIISCYFVYICYFTSFHVISCTYHFTSFYVISCTYILIPTSGLSYLLYRFMSFHTIIISTKPRPINYIPNSGLTIVMDKRLHSDPLLSFTLFYVVLHHLMYSSAYEKTNSPSSIIKGFISEKKGFIFWFPNING